MIKPRVAKKGESFWYRFPDVIQREADGILYIIFLPGRFTLNGIMRGQVGIVFPQDHWPGPFKQKRKPLPKRNKKALGACVYLCVYVCLCVVACVWVCTHVCLRVYMCDCVYECMYACIYMCMHTCVYICVVICLSGLCFPNFSM